MKSVVLLVLLVSFVDIASANRGRRPHERHSKIVEVLEKVEMERRAGRSSVVVDYATRNYLNKRMMEMGVELTDFQNMIHIFKSDLQASKGIKDLFFYSSRVNKDVTERQVSSELLGLLVKIHRNKDQKTGISPAEISRAVEEWSMKELTELKKLLKEMVDQVENGQSPLNALLQGSSPAVREEFKKACL